MKIIPALFIFTFTLVLAGCGEQPVSKPAAESTSKPATPEVAAHLNPKNLIGSWMRNDGNYTIKIDKVKDQGYLSASYFNPSPIHTDKTTYKVEDDSLKVHMLLNDTNYPKCTYDLIYNEEKQMLLGQYYQATSGQTYNVMFSKMAK